MTSKQKTFLISFLCLLLAGAGWRVSLFYQHLNSPLNLSQTELYELQNGLSMTAVARQLEAQGWLSHAGDWLLYAKLSGQAAHLKAGEYALSPQMNALDLLDRFVTGDVRLHEAVIVEGWTLRQALQALQANPNINPIIDLKDPDDVRRKTGLNQYPEGWFFPDTYQFEKGSSDADILQRAHTLMQEVLAQEWQSRDVGLPFNTPYEALIMASIVEKETAVRAERTQIAGVFVRRLQNNMRLQSDPTVIYGLGEDYDGNLRRADLQADNPYNTYKNRGLPPTPIALPGREAIAASLHPDPGDALYFVAKGDGSHHFSASLEEHNAAVRRYQVEQRAENYNSVPKTE